MVFFNFLDIILRLEDKEKKMKIQIFLICFLVGSLFILSCGLRHSFALNLGTELRGKDRFFYIENPDRHHVSFIFINENESDKKVWFVETDIGHPKMTYQSLNGYFKYCDDFKNVEGITNNVILGDCLPLVSGRKYTFQVRRFPSQISSYLEFEH